MTVWRLIRPLDVLYLRGNRLFGGGGDHSEALMPPWPSLFAGAIRSRMLVDAGVDLGRFTEENATAPPALVDALGTPSEPGSFRISAVALLRPGEGTTPAAPVFPLPADVVVTRRKRGGDRPPNTNGELAPDELEVTRLEPVPLPEAVESSARTDLLGLAFRRASPAKPLTGYWLTAEGLARWLAGGGPGPEQLVHCSKLWKPDPRLGIAMDRGSRTSAEGKLYTSETVAMADGAAFLVGIEGVTENQVPADGVLRLGGDGRGAEISPWEGTVGWEGPVPTRGEQFVLYLETPGLFPGGWLPPGIDPKTLLLKIDDLRAQLSAAAVPRFTVVSGWNVAAHRPKPAQRAVPAGAVYFFDRVSGDPTVYAEQLWELVEHQLGDRWDTAWKQRRAEGFNNVILGRWPGGEAQPSGGHSTAGTQPTARR